jgi:hypothetical protein
MIVYHSEYLIPNGYTCYYFWLDRDSHKSTSGYVFTLSGGTISWKSVKQSCITVSTMEAKYIVASEVVKEAIWLRKFFKDLGVILMEQSPITLFCENSEVVAQFKEPRNYKRGKHIERKYHLIRKNLADLFTKSLPQKTFES